MTDTPPKPKRRRWLVVGLLGAFAAIAVISGLRKPHLDPRLIGTWASERTQCDQWTFLPDGMAVCSETKLGRAIPFKWEFVDDQVLLHGHVDRVGARLLAWLSTGFRRALRSSSPAERLQIVEVTESMLRFRRIPGPRDRSYSLEVESFRRLSE